MSASLNPLQATATAVGGPACLELAAQSSASISIEGKAWLGSWDYSRSDAGTGSATVRYDYIVERR